MSMSSITQNNTEIVNGDMRLRRKSNLAGIWKRFCRNKMAVASLVLVLLLIFISVFADFVAPYDYAKQDLSSRFVMPCWAHLLGTDNFGRDLLSRIIYGGRISLLVAMMSVAISLITGGFLGATAGYFGGRYESIVMRIMDVIMAIPAFLLAVSISSMLGSGLQNTALAIAVGGIPSSARLLRATVLQLKDEQFTEAARAMGNSDMAIIFKHIIPNTISPILVDCTLKIGMSILQISGLSFVGLGVQPPTPEWGSILAGGREYIRDFWPLATFPGIAIVITMCAFNLLGDGLRDALDPRMKR